MGSNDYSITFYGEKQFSISIFAWNLFFQMEAHLACNATSKSVRSVKHLSRASFYTIRPIIRIKLIYYAYCLNFDLQSVRDVNGEKPRLVSKILCLPKQIKR